MRQATAELIPAKINIECGEPKSDRSTYWKETDHESLKASKSAEKTRTEEGFGEG